MSPEITEPDKCEAWEWASCEDLQKWVKQQAEAKDGETVGKKLFMPFLNLVRERPGVMPKSL